MSSGDKSEFEIEKSAIRNVRGDDVEIEQSAVLFANGGDIEFEQSAVFAVIGRLVKLKDSAALVVLAPHIEGIGRTALTLHGIAGFALGFLLARWLAARSSK